MSDIDRSIGLAGAVAIGIGGMVGGGIFAVLGEAVSLAHGATAVAFVFAGIVALLTSYSYAHLSVRYQNRGGTVAFVDEAFGHNLLSASLSFLLWLSYLITISLYAVAFSAYAQTFLSDEPSALVSHTLISVAILMPAAINLISVTFVSRSELVFVIIKIALLILIIVSSVSVIDTERLSSAKWGDSLSIVVAGMIIFVAYEGFELIANAAEDIKNPAINLPRAFYTSVALVIVLYILIALVTVGAVDESQLIVAKDYALAVAAEPALGKVGFTLVAIAALLATFSAINATIYGNAALGYMLAKEGELPAALATHRHKIPAMGIVTIVILSLAIANSIDLTEIAIIGSAGFLLVFFIVNISAWKLHTEIKANRTVVLLAVLASGAALTTLLSHTYTSNPVAIVVFLSFVGLSILFELSYGMFVRGHFFQRQYPARTSSNT